MGSQSTTYQNAWAKRILSSLDSWVERLEIDGQAVRTLYFGGGTPSLLEADTIAQVIEHVRALWPSRFEEITLEANPETVTFETSKAWREAGVTRLSLGVQSFQTSLLRRLERLATADDLERACEAVRKYFENWTLDLMLAIPDQGHADLEGDLKKIEIYDPPHLSIYLLTLATNHIWKTSPVMKNKIPDDEIAREFYSRVCEWARGRNYRHYEVSNFAKGEFESIHNSNYWNTHSSYLALGPGAHGYLHSIDGKRMRFVEEVDLKKWVEGAQPTVEWLTAEQQELEEFYMTLRLNRGLSLGSRSQADALAAEGLVSIRNNQVFVTEDGWLCIEAIAAALIPRKS